MKDINRKENALNKKRKMRKLIFCSLDLIIITIIISNIAFSAEEYKPYLHKPSIGKHPKLESFGEYTTDLFPGSGTYNYEIEIPRGTNSFQPSLAITYNGQAVVQRPEILGAGWSITENYIMRHVNFTSD